MVTRVALHTFTKLCLYLFVARYKPTYHDCMPNTDEFSAFVPWMPAFAGTQSRKPKTHWCLVYGGTMTEEKF